jgi:hypothetical protein
MVNNKRSESTNRCSQNVIKCQLQITLDFNQNVIILSKKKSKLSPEFPAEVELDSGFY